LYKNSKIETFGSKLALNKNLTLFGLTDKFDPDLESSSNSTVMFLTHDYDLRLLKWSTVVYPTQQKVKIKLTYASKKSKFEIFTPKYKRMG
jgi:hypothetical protein